MHIFNQFGLFQISNRTFEDFCDNLNSELLTPVGNYLLQFPEITVSITFIYILYSQSIIAFIVQLLLHYIHTVFTY